MRLHLLVVVDARFGVDCELNRPGFLGGSRVWKAGSYVRVNLPGFGGGSMS